MHSLIAAALAFSTASGRSEHGLHKPQSMIASFPDFDLGRQILPSIPTTETAEFLPHKMHFETISWISRVATRACSASVVTKSSGSGPDVSRKSYFNCSLPVRVISKSFESDVNYTLRRYDSVLIRYGKLCIPILRCLTQS